MASAEEPADPIFPRTVEKVQSALDKKWSSSYQRKVVESLNAAPWYFRQDFIDEMSKDQEFKKFTGQVDRPKDPGKVCVDNALAASNYAFPDWYPKGEKFTFELPYLLSQTGFKSINDDSDIFKSSFTTLANKLQAGQMYLIVAKKLDEKIGHMVILTTDTTSNAFLTDKQKLAFNYGLYNYIGWHYGVAPSTRPRPFKQINLLTGTLAQGSWEL
jgi:hypothetical protein